MKQALLTLCLAWAMPARADTTLPAQTTAKKSWADSCAARIDAVAKSLGLRPGARVRQIPLRHEDGSSNPVQYVDFVDDGDVFVSVTVGEDAEPRYRNKDWYETNRGDVFRRFEHRFGIVNVTAYTERLQIAVDECLKMGDPKGIDR